MRHAALLLLLIVTAPGTLSPRPAASQTPVPIYEIQVSGPESPFVGMRLTTTGVVTVILSSGFFMQDPVGDGDPGTSDGIFVFTGTSQARTFAPGDEVTVTGTVVEFRAGGRPRDLPLTELSSVTVVKTGTGAPLPTPVLITGRPDTVISPDGIAAFEALEGMLVEIQMPKVVGATNQFGELVVVAAGDASHTAPSGNILVEPLGGDAIDYNPERIMIDDEARLPGGTGSGTRINNPQVQVMVGNVATGNVVGALDYQFGNYRVQANHPVRNVLTGSFPASPIGGLRPAAPFEGRIATFNVLVAYFCTDATAPVLSVSATPGVLWPPNHRYVTVNTTVSVSDNADPSPAVGLVSVTSSEPDTGLGDGDTANDIVVLGGDFAFELRAERSGAGAGRIYTITYRASDACGNSTVASTTVTVPHDRSAR